MAHILLLASMDFLWRLAVIAGVLFLAADFASGWLS